MSKKEYPNILSSYITFMKYFFYIFIFIIFLYFILGQLFMPNERDVIHSNCRLFETTWERVMDNGERMVIETPGKIPAEQGEVVTLTTTLPNELLPGELICFRTIWQDVTIYVDGELRVDYNTKNSRLFGTNSAMRYIFLDLTVDDAGKELTYQFSSNSKYAGDIRPSYIGDRLSIWLYLFEQSGSRTIIAIFLLLLSLSCIVVCLILKVVYKKTLALSYLAWTIFYSALWMISEIEFRQILFKNVSVLSSFTYWCLMLIPIPLLLYINDIQKGRYQKVLFIPLIYTVTILVVGTFLQIFDIVQFVQQVPYIHVGLLISIVMIIATITIDVFRQKMSDYLAVGIGVYGMIFTAIIEMVLYYVNSTLTLGTVLAVGLLFLLLMAIIKTGQDLFQSEKNKQQAILAREAQAKFLANMSHEIRTPINAIIGMNEMILRENEDTAIQDYSHNIKNASNMLLGLINDVLDFSKIESGQLELVEDNYHLASLLQDEILLLKTRASEKPLSIQLEIDNDLPSVIYGDELRIKQVLTNLLSNAVKYTKQGSVTLKAYSKPIDASTIILSFSVIDTGIGIKQEDLSQLFDSFKRLELSKNRAIQGTGLGLNIAKQLVDLMQGTITVKSDYGKGSTFTVSIPQKVIDKQPIGNLEASIDKLRNNYQTNERLFVAPEVSILIVDDNSMNLSLMKELLKRTKIQIDLATGGKKCLELTREKKYHLIFMDHMMPELDGVETLQMLRAEPSNPNKDTLVIALTANAIAGCREMYLDYGFNDYFSKPIQADKLDELLIEHLPQKLIHFISNTEETKTTMNIENTTTIQNTATSNASSEVPAELLEIDHDTGLSYCLNSEDFYQSMLSEFCLQATEYLPQLESTFKAQNWKEYAIITHGLKGNALNIGATNFSNLSLQHELAGKADNAEYITASYDAYIAALKSLIAKIEAMN